MSYLIVFLGGGIGAALRHGVNRASVLLLGPIFPAGTLFVNIVGSVVIGFLAAWFSDRSSDAAARLFLITGILGGFTTFSAFSLDTFVIWQRGDHLVAAAYVAASVIGSIAGLSLGLFAWRTLA